MFYKIVDNQLIYGPTVHSLEYLLLNDDHANYTYPVDGWYWFPTDQLAKEFFGITEEL